MATISKKTSERLSAGIKRFQPVLSSAKARDVNESDTAIIITDMLSEVFGYDKYSEVTSEHAIRGTCCDLAIKFDGSLAILIELKAIGLELKDPHVKQAVDYAANQGVDWAVLTNGIHWRIYKVHFKKPIDQELVAEFDFMLLDPKSEDHLGMLHLLSKEGWTKSALSDFHDQKQALSRFSIAAVLLSDSMLSAVRRELRRLSPDVKVDVEQIRGVMTHEVLKREVLEGEKAEEANRKLNRMIARMQRASAAAPAVAPVENTSSIVAAEVEGAPPVGI